MSYFKELKIENPLIMAPFNPIGFQMNPSREACERMLKDYPCQLIAMSVLAAGHVKSAAAVVYLNTLPRIDSVVFGASSRDHVEQMATLLRDVSHGS